MLGNRTAEEEYSAVPEDDGGAALCQPSEEGPCAHSRRHAHARSPANTQRWKKHESGLKKNGNEIGIKTMRF